MASKARVVRQSESPVKVWLGKATEPNREPAWAQHTKEKITREPGISHIISCRIDIEQFEDILFTAYRADMPYDVLTEDMIGSGIAIKDGQALLWFDVGNLKRPWQDNEELIVIIEAIRDGRGYYAVVAVALDAQVDIQTLGEVVLVLIPEKQHGVIGYSLYENGARLNNEICASFEKRDDHVVRAVVQGGYETVYGSRGSLQGQEKSIPLSFACSVSPNPFTRMTRFEYALPSTSPVALNIYDVSGRKVATVVSGKHNPGYYSTTWQGNDDAGRKVAAGVYFVRFDAAEYATQEKILLVK
jgi:hypothetical protein